MITKDSKKGSIRGIVFGLLSSLFVTSVTYSVNPFGSEELKQKIISIIEAEMIIFGIIGFVLFCISLVKGWDRIRKKEISDYLSGIIRGTTLTFTVFQFIV